VIDNDDDGDGDDDDDDIDVVVVVELSNTTDLSKFKTSCTIGRSKWMIPTDCCIQWMIMTMTATTTASH